MEFDLSKENIQPLRGGRNVTQLEVALQAQNDSTIQQELLEQKRSFEDAIRTYEGDDPLENWYNYIYWVEQSYPKHGHEGNLIPVLEDCLSKFENDQRYIHDRRLCKLWIKYIDLQQNPLELFQLLHSKGICTSCSDLYRAWAFYHEISGEYKLADKIFQLGFKNLAQPFEELTLAHQNMFLMIGREAVQGIDERRREEERHALTSLVSYKHHNRIVVPSVRTGANILNQNPGIFHNSSSSSSSSSSRQERGSNIPITLYEDLETAGSSLGACASVSILEIARKQDTVHKENTLKPGTWKKSIISKKVPQHRQPSFKVHEDDEELISGGIRLPKDHFAMNHDDFSAWKTEIYFPEPEDDTKIPMYPKHIVYGTPEVEFSLEEIRASKWFTKQQPKVNISASLQETMMEDANIISGQRMVSEVEQAVQSIISTENCIDDYNLAVQDDNFVVPRLSYIPPNISAYEQATNSVQPVLHPQEIPHHQMIPDYNLDQPNTSKNVTYFVPQQWDPSARSVIQSQETIGAAAPGPQWPNNTVNSDEKYSQSMREAMKDINEIWKDTTIIPEPSIHFKKPDISKFVIYEDSKLQEDNFKADKMETKPVECQTNNSKLQFSIYEDTENNKKRISEQKPVNNFRKSLKDNLEFSSQPVPEADCELPRKTPSYSEPFDDKFVHPSELNKTTNKIKVFEDADKMSVDLNDTCSTKVFNINVKQFSTPFNYKKLAAQQYANSLAGSEPKTSKKLLFEEIQEEAKFTQEETIQQDKLSVILETTKEYRSLSSTSSNSGITLKTPIFQRESLKAIPECSRTHDESVLNESHNKNQEPASDICNYSMVKMFLKDDSPAGNRKSYLPPTAAFSSSKNFIDLTGDDSIVQSAVYLNSEVGGVDNTSHPQIQQSTTLMNNYESPMKNQFKEMTCDSSNDSLSNSPVKGQKMDVDVDFKMEHESYEAFDDSILQKFTDPFSAKLINLLLKKVRFPNPKYAKQYIQMQNVPRLIGKKEIVCYGDDKYSVEKVIGKGAFGLVYKAINVNNSQMVALKYQKPSNKWEYYISKEIRERLTNPYMLSAYMDVSACYISQTASVLVSEFYKFGSLLDLTNKIKKVTGKGLKEIVSIYYANEIITIVNMLHQCKIIHADIKPDNFLVTRMPPDFGHPSLQLIDFGCSIDMSLFPPGTTFNKMVNTENFICTEMKDGRPWTYQTDIFCIAATVHVLLFDKYMQLQKNENAWAITQRIPRYLRTDLWNTFFFQMLNIEGCDKLPDLNQIKGSFESIISAHSEELQMELRAVANSVLGR